MFMLVISKEFAGQKYKIQKKSCKRNPKNINCNRILFLKSTFLSISIFACVWIRIAKWNYISIERFSSILRQFFFFLLSLFFSTPNSVVTRLSRTVLGFTLLSVFSYAVYSTCWPPAWISSMISSLMILFLTLNGSYYSFSSPFNKT